MHLFGPKVFLVENLVKGFVGRRIQLIEIGKVLERKLRRVSSSSL